MHCAGTVAQLNAFVVGGRAAGGIWITRQDGAGVVRPGDALCCHSEKVLCVALSGNGTRVASGSSDVTAWLWNVNTDECQQTDEAWRWGDVIRLHFLLREGAVASGKQ